MSEGARCIGLSLPTSFADEDVNTEVLWHLAVLADNAGFSSVSCGEHLLWHAPILDPYLVLASIASLTRRVSLMTGVALAPLRHPLWTVKQANTLAYIAGGRHILGLGAGGDLPQEFEALGRNVGRRGRATDETAAAAAEWLAAGPVSGLPGAGPADELHLGPVLDQPVPVWFGGRVERALERTAAWGDGWLGLFLSPATFHARQRRLREMAAGQPRTGRPDVRAGIQLFVCVDRSHQNARARASNYLAGHFGSADDRMLKHVACGPAARIRERIDEYFAAGADLVQLHLVGGRHRDAADELAAELSDRLPAPPLHQPSHAALIPS